MKWTSRSGYRHLRSHSAVGILAVAAAAVGCGSEGPEGESFGEQSQEIGGGDPLASVDAYSNGTHPNLPGWQHAPSVGVLQFDLGDEEQPESDSMQSVAPPPNFCTGTVIACNLVLTAGHCVEAAEHMLREHSDRGPVRFTAENPAPTLTGPVNPQFGSTVTDPARLHYRPGTFVWEDVGLVELDTPIPQNSVPRARLAQTYPVDLAGQGTILTNLITAGYGGNGTVLDETCVGDDFRRWFDVPSITLTSLWQPDGYQVVYDYHGLALARHTGAASGGYFMTSGDSGAPCSTQPRTGARPSLASWKARSCHSKTAAWRPTTRTRAS